MTTNTAIWERVCETDPKHTKGFNRSGGFKGTGINATWLAQRATEVFGPIGTGWGLDKLEEQYVTGAPIIDAGNVVAHEIIHVVYVCLWYMQDGNRGEVHQFGQTQFVGKNKYGAFTDEEAPKKSLTDAMTKCLSLLGFAADVHLGLYDDNKYVAEMRQQFAEEPEKPQPIEQKPPAKPSLPPQCSAAIAALKELGCKTPDDYRAVIAHVTNKTHTPEEVKTNETVASALTATLAVLLKTQAPKALLDAALAANTNAF